MNETLTPPQTEQSSATTWLLGGILVVAAVGVYVLEKKGPEPFRYRRA